jgi:ethanolamine ammonia-lyase small subunit
VTPDRRDRSLAPDSSDLVRELRDRTPARLMVGRAGGAYRTETQLQLREDHAAARDAVGVELSLNHHLGPDFVKEWYLFEVSTEAKSKEEYLRYPNLGRRLTASAREEIARNCARGGRLQIAIGDGLSVAAVAEQVPQLLPALVRDARSHGWTLGRPFVIRHCRVGVMNDIGELLAPEVVVLLIGERPGLATASSLSAYMAFRPTRSHTDADRNLISNIHGRGISTANAAASIIDLAEHMMKIGRSGYRLGALRKHGTELGQ